MWWPKYFGLCNYTLGYNVYFIHSTIELPSLEMYLHCKFLPSDDFEAKIDKMSKHHHNDKMTPYI